MKNKAKDPAKELLSIGTGGSSKRFDDSGTWRAWVNNAEKHHRASQILFSTLISDMREHFSQGNKERNQDQKPFLLEVYFLLCYLAIENLLKALSVKKDPLLVSKGKLRGPLMNSHDIAGLISNLVIPLSEDEVTFTSHGQSCIEYWGRYPIPKNPSDLINGYAFNTRVNEVFIKLYTRLKQNL